MHTITLAALIGLFAGSLAAGPVVCVGDEPAPSSPTCPEASEPACVYREEFPRERVWRMSVMPYLWAAGVKGTVTSMGIPSAIDAGFSDIVKAMEYGAFGQIELARGRCFVLADTLLLKANVGASAEKRFLGPLGLGEFEGEADVNLDVLFWFQDLVAGYRVYDTNLCSCPGQERRFSLDLLAGARYYYADLGLNASAQVTVEGPLGEVRTRKKSASLKHEEDWFDPIVGARMQYDVTDRLGLTVKGDVGGFGIGSDLSWSAAALATYELSDHWNLIGGYKVLDVDYDNGKGGAMDTRMAGPIAAFEYRVRF